MPTNEHLDRENPGAAARAEPGELQVMLETVGSRSTGLGAGRTAENSLHYSPGSPL